MYGIYQYLARSPTIQFVLLTLYLFCMVQIPKGKNFLISFHIVNAVGILFCLLSFKRFRAFT